MQDPAADPRSTRRRNRASRHDAASATRAASTSWASRRAIAPRPPDRCRAWISAALAAGALALAPLPASATERRFAYTYGSGVLAPGDLEIEPWTTFRVGRDGFYNRLDHRLELEAGVTDCLQAAFYLNWAGTARDEMGVRFVGFDWKGVSLEWKYKLSDPVADALGFALYFEPGLGPAEAELEGKIILDKQVGRLYAALNAVAEHEWEFEAPGETKRELLLEVDLGLAWLFTPALSAGIEVRNHNEIVPGEGWEHSALFAGPVVSYATRRWWATLTLMPQLPALKAHGPNPTFVLDEHESFNARLLLGFHL